MPDDNFMKRTKLKTLQTKKKVGLVVVITGHGKGKTTSALGMALRAVGYGMKVCIVEFIKGDMYSGEIDAIKRLSPDVELHITGKGFCGIKGDAYSYKEHRAKAQEALKLAKKKMSSGKFGRDAHPEVIKRANTVTEMKEIKHAFRQGIEPQKGIDY
jgi:cob(I)alamin adenosyltransferase